MDMIVEFESPLSSFSFILNQGRLTPPKADDQMNSDATDGKEVQPTALGIEPVPAAQKFHMLSTAPSLQPVIVILLTDSSGLTPSFCCWVVSFSLHC